MFKGQVVVNVRLLWGLSDAVGKTSRSWNIKFDILWALLACAYRAKFLARISSICNLSARYASIVKMILFRQLKTGYVAPISVPSPLPSSRSS